MLPADTPEPEWAELWERDPRATPFQHPAWALPWARHLCGSKPIFVEARQNGRLTALLPGFLWQTEGRKLLVPLAAGHSDYSDALFDPDHPPALDLGAMEADALMVPDLRPCSPLIGARPTQPGEPCPVLPLPGSELAAILPAHQRRKLAMARHRAERLGGVTTALAAAHEVGDALTALFALHAARWEAAGEPGVLADPRIQAWHREAAPALARAGLLRMVLVRHHMRIVAVLYALADRSRVHGYITGVDTTHEGQSFGTLALAHLLELALAEGKAEFHFLRGREPYKLAWGAQMRETVRLTLPLR